MRSGCSLTSGKLVFRFPAGLILPDPCCSLSLLICSHKPKPGTLIHYRQPESDDLHWPTPTFTVTLPSSEEHVNLNKVIKDGVWNEKPKSNLKSHPFAKGYATAAQIPEQMPVLFPCYTVVFSRKIISHPWATVTPQSGRLGVSPVEQLHVVVAAVCLLFNLKGLEYKLHAVAFLCRDHPLAVGSPGVVVVPKLGVWEQVLGFDFSLQTTSTLCTRAVLLDNLQAGHSVGKLRVKLLWSLARLWFHSCRYKADIHMLCCQIWVIISLRHGSKLSPKTKAMMDYVQNCFWNLTCG